MHHMHHESNVIEMHHERNHTVIFRDDSCFLFNKANYYEVNNEATGVTRQELGMETFQNRSKSRIYMNSKSRALSISYAMKTPETFPKTPRRAFRRGGRTRQDRRGRILGDGTFGNLPQCTGNLRKSFKNTGHQRGSHQMRLQMRWKPGWFTSRHG